MAPTNPLLECYIASIYSYFGLKTQIRPLPISFYIQSKCGTGWQRLKIIKQSRFWYE